MKIISWNVNGIRAIQRKGFLDWLHQEKPDVIGLQEIKAQEHQLDQEILAPKNYHSYFNPAERKGYSGTAIYSRQLPPLIENGLGVEEFDNEGRTMMVDYGDFVFFNIYFPNGKRSPERLKYKLDFYEAALKKFDQLVAQGKKLVIAGDYNTAHNAIDLARPEQNENVSGFLRIERDWLDKLIAHGYIDCFRQFFSEPDHYTWWSFRSAARKRNVGWRIDYFFVSQNLRPQLKNCYHLDQVTGSDHCPIVLELKR